MKLKQEFYDFYKSIKIDVEANSLIEKRETLQDDIVNHLPEILENKDITINKSDIRIIDQGSYKYKTTIKSDVVDRDVAIIIPLSIDDNKDPRAIKRLLKEAIDIQSRTIIFKEPCVRVIYHRNGIESFHIDLPLYAKTSNGLYLARGKDTSNNYSWEPADPDGLNEYICNKLLNNDQLRRIICFIKKWKNEAYKSSPNDHMIPPSIGLTLLACYFFTPQSSDEGDDDLVALQKTMKSIQEYFTIKRDRNDDIISANINCILPVTPNTDVFNKMKNASESYMITFYNRLSKAVNNLTNAVIVESSHDAGKYVQRVLGDQFIVPPKDAVVASVKNSREHSFG